MRLSKLSAVALVSAGLLSSAGAADTREVCGARSNPREGLQMEGRIN